MVTARPFFRSSQLVLACALLLVASNVWAGSTKVRFRLIETASGKITPAMVSITGAGGEVRLPPDGRIMGKPSPVSDFYKGVHFNPDPHWIGPVRDTRPKRGMPYVGRTRDGQLTSFPPIPYWHEPVMFQVSGDFTIDLPGGQWRIAVERGKEYVPVVEEFRVDGKGSVTKTIRLERWINLPERGWWSGDVHVHHPSRDKLHREFMLEFARASDLHVVNLLEMGHHWIGTDFKQAGFGKKFRVQRGDYGLVSGQEDPRGFFGHIIGLNISRMVRDLKTYDWYDVAFKGIHEQEGAMVGFAHFAVGGSELMKGFPWFVTTGEVDFIEILQFGRINTLDYYDYLNLGFKLTAAAGSDIPFGAVMGEVRTYVHTGPKLDIDAWFEGLEKGHTFVSNGPVVELTVDNKLPGSEIAKGAGDTVTIKARALSHPSIGIIRELTLVGNEGPIRRVTNPEGKNELTVEMQRKVGESEWLVAGVVCENGAVAHTTPIYILVEGRPHWSAKRGPAVIRKQLAAIEKIRERFAGINDRRTTGINARLDRARDYYLVLLAKMER